MKANLKKLTAGLLMMSGSTVLAANEKDKLFVKSEIMENLTRQYSDEKIKGLFDNSVFELTQSSGLVTIDTAKLKQIGTTTEDYQLLQLEQNLRRMGGVNISVKKVNAKDIVLSTQDRGGEK